MLLRYSLIPLNIAAYGQVTVNPSRITRRPWEAFSFTCNALDQSRPIVVFGGSDQPLEYDTRFSIVRPSPNSVIVTASQGLRELDGNMTFE